MGKRVNLFGRIHASLCGKDLPNIRTHHHTQYFHGATNAIFKLKTMIIFAYLHTELRIKSTKNTHTYGNWIQFSKKWHYNGVYVPIYTIYMAVCVENYFHRFNGKKFPGRDAHVSIPQYGTRESKSYCRRYQSPIAYTMLCMANHSTEKSVHVPHFSSLSRIKDAYPHEKRKDMVNANSERELERDREGEKAIEMQRYIQKKLVCMPYDRL